MIRARNLTCAGPLLRLQIDTALRFYATGLVDDPHELASRVLRGERIDKMKSRDNKRLRDFYLVEKIAEREAPWLPAVYESTSGYVHLSNVHMHASLSPGNKAGAIKGKIAFGDKPLPDELYQEAIEAFVAAVELLGRLIWAWTLTKEHVDVISAIKKSPAFRKAIERGEVPEITFSTGKDGDGIIKVKVRTDDKDYSE